MDHSEAANSQAVERYLLGEMTEPEAEAFEEHFFECRICTEELTFGSLLEENARAGPVTAPATVDRLGWSAIRAWWRRPAFAAPAFAALALAIVAGHQARELARLSQPQASAFYVLKTVRAEGPANVIPANRDFVTLNVDLPPDESFPRYRCDVYGASGRLAFSVPVPAPAAGASLSMVVPKGLAPGEYELRVFGLHDSQSESVAAHYRITAVKQP
ncbi:MAG TPA: zf-HC2 domain-containing protein [Bryobacteraceae bacterium]|nr:zf-HC2 domain-containing protein [Bryobacteraceae bacterium]